MYYNARMLALATLEVCNDLWDCPDVAAEPWTFMLLCSLMRRPIPPRNFDPLLHGSHSTFDPATSSPVLPTAERHCFSEHVDRVEQASNTKVPCHTNSPPVEIRRHRYGHQHWQWQWQWRSSGASIPEPYHTPWAEAVSCSLASHQIYITNQSPRFAHPSTLWGHGVYGVDSL